ncbi:MAG TPA: hypothetical protein VHT03_06420 [Rhizomicrobium sp.]|jgi:hypothetical protein|nr:hypothetical protein [Rhizomicrobium sp.]
MGESRATESAVQLPIASAIAACEAAIQKITSDIGEYWEFGTAGLPAEQTQEWGDKEGYVARCSEIATRRLRRLLEICTRAKALGSQTVSVSASDLELLTDCHKPES